MISTINIYDHQNHCKWKFSEVMREISMILRVIYLLLKIQCAVAEYLKHGASAKIGIRVTFKNKDNRA